MAFINVHLFTSIEEANQAIETINQGEGIPVSDDAVTRTYCDYQENEGRVFIHADEVTEKYLGIPTEIEIIYEEI